MIERQFIAFACKVPKLISSVMNKRTIGTSSQATSSQQATPSQQAISKSGVGSSIQSLPGKGKEKETRKQSSIDDTKKRDGWECILIHTTVTEAAHIYPVANIKAAEECKDSLRVLDFIWGGDTCEKFKDALSIKDLDIPMNMVTLDNAPHHLIDLVVRILEPLDWSKRKRAGSALPDGLATDPRTKMKNHMNPTGKLTKTAKERTDVRFVSADTQHRIYDGHRLTITSDDPDLLPSVELLRLRDRVMAMMTLKGGADVDDDVLSSSSGGDDAPRVLVGDGDFEVDLEDKVLEWSERAGGELAPLTAEEADEMACTSSVTQQPENVGDIFPSEGQPEDRGDSRGED
ncbi:hypothetical protein ColTof3_12380 [Colletotrichum tofieldiae]|nr:hypothetical protein ColTof3_12380 [Colletotrichum tofieldiae]